jgi:hypothetical protein
VKAVVGSGQLVSNSDRRMMIHVEIRCDGEVIGLTNKIVFCIVVFHSR